MLPSPQLRDEREQQASCSKIRYSKTAKLFSLPTARCLWQKIEYMHSQNIDYAAIKDRLKSLQPKNRLETRNAQLAHLREELRDARKRGVSINTLSAELKAGGITISSAALAKYLSRRSSAAPAKRSSASGKANQVAPPHGQVKTGTKEPEQRESGTGPK
jgi:hypothetical protein